MTPTAVISSLKARGVELWQEGDALRYRAPAGALTDREKAALRAHKASILKALAAQTLSTAIASPTSVASTIAVTEPLPTRTESLQPEPKDRLCYQCQHFQRSPYRFPLGLCQQHGNRIQHSTSQPTHFGCGFFELRTPDDPNRTCLQCRHYSQQSTMWGFMENWRKIQRSSA